MRPRVDLSAEWWRRSSIFCMAVQDSLRHGEWAITLVYNRGVGSWWRGKCIWAQSLPPSRVGRDSESRWCPWLKACISRDHGLSWALRTGNSMLVTQQHFTTPRPQTKAGQMTFHHQPGKSFRKQVNFLWLTSGAADITEAFQIKLYIIHLNMENKH